METAVPIKIKKTRRAPPFLKESMALTMKGKMRKGSKKTKTVLIEELIVKKICWALREKRSPPRKASTITPKRHNIN